METKQIPHMTKEDGEFSYSSNTTTYRKYCRLIKPVLEIAIKSLLQNDTMRQNKSLSVADLGCGVGSSPIAFISTIVESVQKTCNELKWDDCDVPEIQVFLSDLPSNDYNFLFKDMEKLQNSLKENGMPLCFIMGTPGSFYERLFPRNSVHLVHSYYAIHWLSEVPNGLLGIEGEPLNKGMIVVSDTSVPQVKKAYYDQFEFDFSTFLNCRSHEIAPNGYMVLSTLCRPSVQPREARTMKFLFQALDRLVFKGVIEQEKLDIFNLPVYYPCKEEIQEIVTKQGSFIVENLRVVSSEVQNDQNHAEFRAVQLAKLTRSYTQILVSNHFGEHIWNELHNVLRQVIFEHFKSNRPLDVSNIVIFLRKQID